MADDAPSTPEQSHPRGGLPANPPTAGGATDDIDNWLVDCLLPGAMDPVRITVRTCREGTGQQVGKPIPPTLTDGGGPPP
jgi:hypothetical protein